ncbi:hypothetical protein D918_08886 [Trichuris suis]|nr:hypothetical protein D918_08886 [Trichuris suis]
MAVNQAELLKLTIKALCSVLSFCSNHSSEVQSYNLLALRFIEGQLPAIAYESSFLRDGGNGLPHELREVQANVSALANVVVPHVLENDAKTFLKVKSFLAEPYAYYPNRRSIQASKRWRMVHNELLDVKPTTNGNQLTSRILNCLSELNRLLEYSNGDDSVAHKDVDCQSISAGCIHYWLYEKSLLGYHLVGRILLTAAFQQVSLCTSDFEALLRQLKYRSGFEELRLELCSNLFYVMEHRVVSNGGPGKQDTLAWLMQLSCSHASFKEFLRLSWLPPLLHHQHATGCYTAAMLTGTKSVAHRFTASTPKCDMFATAVASALLVCYIRCLAMGDCDTTDGFGEPAIAYDYGAAGTSQLDADNVWLNRTVLEQLEAISRMHVRFGRLSDVTLYWDQNGFKCHLTSESHQRQLLLFSECPGRYMNEFSTEFQKVFLDILRRQFGTKRVKANTVYQEYIKDRHHVHMNATCWYTLTGFVNYLGRVGICKVDKTEKGWYIQYIDKEAEERREKQTKKLKMDKDDEERTQELIMRQAERALELQKRNGEAEATEPVPSELKREDDQKIEFKLPSLATVVSKIETPSKEVVNPLKRQPPLREGSVACSVASSKSSRVSKTALAEIMEAEERRKELRNRKECWLHKGIVVKIVSAKYGKQYVGRKAVVTSVEEEQCTATVSVLDTDESLDVHQKSLETVIPALNKTVLVVNGAYRGLKATLESIDVDRYCATIRIKEGLTRGRVVDNIDYEDISKWCE